MLASWCADQRWCVCASVQVVKKAKLTKLAFNPKHPIILVGDDKGCVTSLKLSPNLRQRSVPEKGQKFEEMEIAKLDAVIEVGCGMSMRIPRTTAWQSMDGLKCKRTSARGWSSTPLLQRTRGHGMGMCTVRRRGGAWSGWATVQACMSTRTVRMVLGPNTISQAVGHLLCLCCAAHAGGSQE